jgi:hypothetical protein
MLFAAVHESGPQADERSVRMLQCTCANGAGAAQRILRFRDLEKPYALEYKSRKRRQRASASPSRAASAIAHVAGRHGSGLAQTSTTV